MDEKIISDCLFCNPGSPVFSHPLDETANFRIAAHHFPLMEGHLVLIPKTHFSCMGELPDPIFSEFELIYGKIMSFLIRSYGSAACFERGKFHRTIYHSQMHFLPADICLAQILPEGPAHAAKFGWLNQLQQAFQEDDGYLFLGIGNDKWLLDPAISTPRFFRERLGNAIGKPERADWRAMGQDPILMSAGQREFEALKTRWQLTRPDLPNLVLSNRS